MRIAAALLALASWPVAAQVGFYKLSAPPGSARIYGEMCIEKGSGKSLRVRLFGSYCPTVGDDCANVRFDGMEFEAQPTQRGLSFKNQTCMLNVSLRKHGATVTQQGHCTDYDLLAGAYVKVAPEVWEDDCSPNGSDETHHK